MPDMIDRIDHIVLTVRSVEASCAFYERALGLRRIDTPGPPTAVAFGRQKINLHQVDHTFEPKAEVPTPGSGDFCLITERDLEEVRAHLESAGVVIELGPIRKTGALGPITSLYFRDPDDNLVEVSRYDQA